MSRHPAVQRGEPSKWKPAQRSRRARRAIIDFEATLDNLLVTKSNLERLGVLLATVGKPDGGFRKSGGLTGYRIKCWGDMNALLDLAALVLALYHKAGADADERRPPQTRKSRVAIASGQEWTIERAAGAILERANLLIAIEEQKRRARMPQD